MIIIIAAIVIGLALIAFAIFRQMRSGGISVPPLSENTKTIIKISAAGAILLILLYALVPEFIVKHHKEIIILVVAMIAGAILLGIKQDWEKSSTRKILKAHYAVLSVVLIAGIFYSDPEVRDWLEDFRPESALQPQAVAAEKVVELFLFPGEEKDFEVADYYWFRVKSDDMVKPMTWDGKEIKDGWMGDNIRAAHLRFKSYEIAKKAKVTIYLRPK